MTAGSAPPAGGLDAGRLWKGGAATAVVAALTAVVGILVARGVLGIPVLAPQGDGVWGNASTLTYALAAAGGALAATALLHLLALATSRLGRFFSWIMILLTAISALLPLTLDVNGPSRVATAALNLIIGLTITTILNGVARGATRSAPGA